MITFKPIIIQGGRRKDGTYPVKIRVTFRGEVRRLPTTLTCTDGDLTRSGKIKNATVLERAGELISRMREACAGLSPFTLETLAVDDVVAHIKGTLAAGSFRLDLFDFAQEVMAAKAYHTQLCYRAALNALEHFLWRRSLDVNDITRRMLLDFVESAGEHSGPRHLAKLAAVFRAARDKYNDEDTGVILIPRQPFTRLPQQRPLGKGQKPLPPEVIQRFIDWSPDAPWDRVAKAAALVSFGMMGANIVDLWNARGPLGKIFVYNRQKNEKQ